MTTPDAKAVEQLADKLRQKFMADFCDGIMEWDDVSAFILKNFISRKAVEKVLLEVKGKVETDRTSGGGLARAALFSIGLTVDQALTYLKKHEGAAHE